MKPNIFSYIRNQKKLVRIVIFFISWTQMYGYSYASYFGRNENHIKNHFPKIVTNNSLNNSRTENESIPLKDAESLSHNPTKFNKTDISSETGLPTSLSSLYYNSDIKEGVIGKDKDHPIDQVFDNIFNITVDELSKNRTITLEYDLFGVADFSGISKVVNDEHFSGGLSTEHNQSWSHQSEPVETTTLVKGINTVLFTISPDADYTYKVKNVRLKITSSGNKSISDNNTERLLSGTVAKEFFKDQPQNFSIGNAGLETQTGSLNSNTIFSITPLEVLDIPAIAPEMVNVTSEKSGYRFLPHGEHFQVPAKVSLGYDKNKIPAGYTEKDIKTYFFDRVSKKWIALEKDSLQSEKHILVSKTTHFTDMINGIIKVPESPETGSYAPNSIKDIKAADPVSGIVSIAAPSPNNQGSVTTGFPIKLPAGRQGMQPSLSVNYNSDGGNGWLGLGWDLSIPAVTIDTRWGVPTYDQGTETEIYTLGGEQLAFEASAGVFAMPNRNEGFEKSRQADRQFYPRIEGAYNKTIRHGDSPSTYWWEVIGKDGTRHYFGGDGTNVVENTVLRQPNTNNIGYWALYRSIDTNGNYTQYIYDKKIYNGTPGNGGQEFYISQIQYAKNDNAPTASYSVDFFTDSVRKDVQINARLGFVQVTASKLNTVRVRLNRSIIRSYNLTYDEGAFYKTRLTSITEKDQDGADFYTNRMEYNEAPSQIFGAPQPWTAQDPAIFSGLQSSLGFNQGYSMLAGSLGKSTGTNFGISVGAFTFTSVPPSDTSILSFRKGTVGAHGSISNASSLSKVTLVDIDGDNLPDRVYEDNGSISYSKNLSTATNGIQAFGPKMTIGTLSNIGKSKNSSWGVGIDGNFAGASLGFDYSNTTSTTSSYFMDFNDDGLVDFVRDGKVYFNRINGNVPTFNEDSGLTPYPINISASAAQPSASLFDDQDKTEKKMMLEQNPLHDIVRVWVAPRDGSITVKNAFNLNQIACNQEEDCSKADGVAIAFQYKNNDPLVQNINAGDFNTYSFADQVINIVKGEKLYFRVSSKYDGTLDQVTWNPEIFYSAFTLPEVDSDNKNLSVYKAQEDFVNTNGSSFSASGDGDLKLFLDKPLALSDNAKIILTVNGVETTIQVPSATSYNNSMIGSTVSLHQNDQVSVKVYTDTQIDWTKFKLTAEYTETSSGEKTYLQVKQSMYNDRGSHTIYTIQQGDVNTKITVKAPSLPSLPSFGSNGRIVISAKTKNKLLTKTAYNVTNDGSVVTPVFGTPYTITSADATAGNNEIYLETTVISDTVNFVNNVSSISAVLINNGLNYINTPNNLTHQLPNANETTHSIGTIIIGQNSTLNFMIGDYAVNTSAVLSLTNTATGLGVVFPNGTLSGQPGLFTSTTANLVPGIYQYDLSFFQGNPIAYTRIYLTNGGSESTMTSFTNAPPHKPIVFRDQTTVLNSNQYDGRFGILYRGWGAFVLNGNNAGKTNITESYDINSNFANGGTVAEMKIDETLLKMNDSYATDPGTNPTINNPTVDGNGNVTFADNNGSLSKNYFLATNSNVNNNDKGRIIDVDPTVYISSSAINASRLGVHNIDSNFNNYSLSQVAGSQLNAPSIMLKNQSVSVAGGFSAGFAGVNVSQTLFSEAKSIRNVIDYNGDGFPDDFNKTNVKITHPVGFLSGRSFDVGSQSISKASSTGISSGYSFVHGESSRMAFIQTIGENSKYNAYRDEVIKSSAQSQAAATKISISANGESSTENSKQTFVDINGDGLPDKFNSGQFELNTGSNFAGNDSWGTDFVSEGVGNGLGAGLGISLFRGSFEFGVNFGSNTSQTTKELIDINGDGLPDKVYYSGDNATVYLNTGVGMSANPLNVALQNADDIHKDVSINVGGNVAGSIVIPIPVSLVAGIKLNVTAGVSKGSTTTRSQATFKDVNGDGYPDFVKSDNADQITVQLNQISTTNLLKKVTLPTGGSWEVTYERKGNTYEMPQSRYVMTSVVVKDGFAQDDTFKPGVSKITVAYNNPYHSRRERTFYGFNEVRTNQINTANGGANATQIFRYTVQHFNNSSYFLKGSLLDETLYDATNRKWTETLHTISARALGNTNSIVALPTYEAEKTLTNYTYFVTENKTISNFYEGQSTIGKSTYNESLSYDNYGNLKQYKDYGDQQIGSTETLTTDIVYQISDSGSDYMILPKTVTSTATGLTRSRIAYYDNKGNLGTMMMIGSGNSVYSYAYDTYGNIITATLPQNANGETFWKQYTYDDAVATYPIKVEDAFGYSSKTDYDINFGVPLFTEDMNLQPMQYSYDTKGRLLTVTGPYELFNDIPWTIQMEYHPVTNAPADATTAQSYVVTRHYDPEIAGNTINTISIADGLGAAIQLKKTANIFSEDGFQQRDSYIVSGKVVQDAFGRALKSYYPTVGSSNIYLYDPAVDTIEPTTATYDVMDRALTTKLPGEQLYSKVQYDFGTDRLGRKMFHTQFTDELGSIKHNFADVKGRTTTVHEESNTGDIITSFTHDAIGQLLQAKDVEGNLTTSIYDDLGRRTSMTQPDNGTTTLTYDPAGNLTSKTTAENETVTYQYEYNRLKGITYPNYPENNVAYYYGAAQNSSAADDNAIGRLWYQTDATGTQRLRYGKLGELTSQRRSVAVAAGQAYWFGTEWEYDTWNRVKNITYPDGEKVTYAYNIAGNLNNMVSVKDGHLRKIINNIGYDKFEQRVYLAYGNGTETRYEYENERRRLLKMKAQNSARTFMDNLYQYDVVSNVLQVHNNAPVALSGLLGGGTNYAYGYDDLYRLTTANGNWKGMDSDGNILRQRYTYTMAYDDMHNIMSKVQKHETAPGNTGNDWTAVEPTSYMLNYKYEGSQPHAPSTIVDQPNLVPTTTCCDPNDPGVKFMNYSYDAKGNPTGINKETCTVTEAATTHVWDEENRLQTVDTNPSTLEVDGLALYTYDAGGERIIKDVAYTGIMFKDGAARPHPSIIHTYTIYPNGLLTMTLNQIDLGAGPRWVSSYTKHYYAGSQRISGALGSSPNTGTFNCDWLIIPFGNGGAPINEKEVALQKAKAAADHGNKILGQLNINGADYGQGGGYDENCTTDFSGEEESDVYWYHPDHLGSSSFITGIDGEVNQNMEYFPSGETFVENHLNSYNIPYKFNAKELDDETGYYYYGARYYNPRISLWLSVDPDFEKYPGWSPYNYAFNSPVRLIDPDGRGPLDIIIRGANNSSFTIKTKLVNSDIRLSSYGINKDFGGNYSMSLNELKPDAIGIDLGASLNLPIWSGGIGANLIWHTRGSDAGAKPELHTYMLGSASGNTDASIGANLGLIFAWATKPDGSMASNNYVANGVNWTGTFWGASIAIGEAWAAGGASYFTARDPGKRSSGEAWSGFGISWTPQLSATAGLGKTGGLLGKILNGIKKGTLGGSLSKSYYWMNYGNGGDHLENGKNVSGWHIINPIDPKDNK